MPDHRSERLQELIKEEFSDIVRRELKDPRIGFISVTDVELSSDYSHAKVFISVFGDPEIQKKAMAGLESAKGFIRTELGKRIHLRHTPDLQIIADNSIERGAKIMKLLEEVKKTER